MSDIPQDSDYWGDGKTLGEMRRLCPDPALTAHERNNPIELAAIEAGLTGWDAWEVYDGNYSDNLTGLHVSPNTRNGGWEISWPGDCDLSTREEMIEVLRELASAILRVTSDSPTSSSNRTITMKATP